MHSPNVLPEAMNKNPGTAAAVELLGLSTGAPYCPRSFACSEACSARRHRPIAIRSSREMACLLNWMIDCAASGWPAAASARSSVIISAPWPLIMESRCARTRTRNCCEVIGVPLRQSKCP